jgi:hypothetical protein
VGLTNLGSDLETCVGSRVHLVGVSISFEKNFYRLPFTPPSLVRRIGPSEPQSHGLLACRQEMDTDPRELTDQRLEALPVEGAWAPLMPLVWGLTDQWLGALLDGSLASTIDRPRRGHPVPPHRGPINQGYGA